MQRGSESRLCRDLRFLGCSASPLRHFIRRSTAEQLRSVGSGYRATAHASDRLALLSVTRSLRSKPPGIRSSPPGWLLACYNSSAFALATMLTSLCRRAQRWLLAGLGESGNSPLPPLRETRPAHTGVTCLSRLRRVPPRPRRRPGPARPDLPPPGPDPVRDRLFQTRTRWVRAGQSISI